MEHSGYIELVATEDSLKQGGVGTDPPLCRMRNVDRARRSVQAAMDQLPATEAGGVILDLDTDTDVGTTSMEVARYLLIHPDTFPRCRFVMLRTNYANHWDPKPWGVATAGEDRIVRALCGYAGHVDVVRAVGSAHEALDPARGVRPRQLARLDTEAEQQNAYRISLLDRIWAARGAR